MSSVTTSKVKTLVLGPLPPPFSGTTVSFQELVRDLGMADGIDVVSILNTEADKSSGVFKKAGRALKLGIRTVLAVTRTEVVLFNASARRAVFFGAFLAVVARVFRRPLVIRVFGGGLFDEYQQGGRLFRWCAHQVFGASKVLLQTHSLVDLFGKVFPAGDIVWFPTSRNHGQHLNEKVEPKAMDTPVRFIYATEVRDQKGIDTLLKVFGTIDRDHANLDVYGALFKPYFSQSSDGFSGWPASVKYQGSIDSDSLRAVLPSYDCLLLPTRCESEGYPGIIIEAFGAGVPVITSRMGSIPEIADESCGMVLDPLNVDEWVEAIGKFAASPVLRADLAAGARERGKLFDSRIWNREKMEQLLRDAASGLRSS